MCLAPSSHKICKNTKNILVVHIEKYVWFSGIIIQGLEPFTHSAHEPQLYYIGLLVLTFFYIFK